MPCARPPGTRPRGRPPSGGPEVVRQVRQWPPADRRPLLLVWCATPVSPLGRARVRAEVVLEVVDQGVGGTTTPEDQVGLREQRAVLADPAEVVGGLAGHDISDEPPTAAWAMRACDREERIERGRLVVVGRGNDRATRAGR